MFTVPSLAVNLALGKCSERVKNNKFYLPFLTYNCINGLLHILFFAMAITDVGATNIKCEFDPHEDVNLEKASHAIFIIELVNFHWNVLMALIIYCIEQLQ